MENVIHEGSQPFNLGIMRYLSQNKHANSVIARAATQAGQLHKRHLSWESFLLG